MAQNLIPTLLIFFPHQMPNTNPPYFYINIIFDNAYQQHFPCPLPYVAPCLCMFALAHCLRLLAILAGLDLGTSDPLLASKLNAGDQGMYATLQYELEVFITSHTSKSHHYASLLAWVLTPATPPNNCKSFMQQQTMQTGNAS